MLSNRIELHLIIAYAINYSSILSWIQFNFGIENAFFSFKSNKWIVSTFYYLNTQSTKYIVYNKIFEFLSWKSISKGNSLFIIVKLYNYYLSFLIKFIEWIRYISYDTNISLLEISMKTILIEIKLLILQLIIIAKQNYN
jgi:hypothetical protein